MSKWTARLLAVAMALTVAPGLAAQQSPPLGPPNGNLGEMDYGVCRGPDIKCFHDWPRTKTADYRVLLFTHTAGPRHEDLGKPLAAGLNPPLDDSNVVQREMLKLLAAQGIKMDYTEDPKILLGINTYNAVVFYSTSRDALDDNAKTALRQYLRAGGGFVGIHNAFGTLYNWPYYEGLLGGANYYDHGPERSGEVVIQDSKDASTRDLPKRWQFTDEWYNLVPFPTHVRFLATVDERSYGAPTARPVRRPLSTDIVPQGFVPPSQSVVGHHPGHGDFHPVAWCQYYDGGKSWVTTLGHDAGAFAASDTEFPGSQAFQKLIIGGIKSVMGAEPFCQ